jgi:DNA-binding NarL/FixJ family response regulator
MNHSVLVIDDEQQQAEGMKKFLKKERPNFFVESAFKETDILEKIESLYFDIAIVDLQMNDFEIDGIIIIRKILEANPFARIIIVSGYLPSYDAQIAEISKSGKIETVIEKTSIDIFTKKILGAIDSIVEAHEKYYFHQNGLQSLYAEAKNETDKYSKGTKFERFVGFLFSQMGFIHISKRVKDQSLGEVDLIVRNELNDLFFQKFKPYILIECKNTAEKVDINDFKLFYGKLEHTNGMANLGFLITSNTMKSTVYQEAMRTSGKGNKVIFITHLEIARLIQSSNLLDTMKAIIDEQVKDN